MPKPKTSNILNPKPQSQVTLSEYVTAIAWSSDSKYLAAATASGEVVIFNEAIAGNDLATKQLTLQAPTETAVDCLGFSADGKWLATGGQDGKVRVWDFRGDHPAIAATLDLGKTWIEHLVWHPSRAEFAFGLGKYVQIWSADALDIVTTLHFEKSTTPSLARHRLYCVLCVGIMMLDVGVCCHKKQTIETNININNKLDTYSDNDRPNLTDCVLSSIHNGYESIRIYPINYSTRS